MDISSVPVTTNDDHRWRVYDTLTENLWKQQQQGKYVDLTLVFSCGTICAVHKCVMAAMSRYLMSRIESMEAPDKPLVINGV